jgi:hypothetical protein
LILGGTGRALDAAARGAADSKSELELGMAQTRTDDWRPLFRIGALGAAGIVLLIPIQILFFVVWPPQLEVEWAFAIFTTNWFRGLESFDLLLLLDAILNVPVFLALGMALWNVNRSFVLLALTLMTAGTAAYFGANTSFELWDLATQHAAATDPETREQLSAAGRFALATFQGTGFAVYYVLAGLETLLVSSVMLRGGQFGRVTGWIGVAAGLTMLVPPLPATGQFGLVLSLASLAPLIVWLVLVARRLWLLGD